MLGAFWDISLGEHPRLLNGEDNLFSFSPAFKDESIPEHIDEYDLPLMPCVNGHNVIADDTVQGMLNISYQAPISPLFAKDLCGRTVYLGYGPEFKDAGQWNADKHVTFPKGCRLVTGDIEGSDLIENVFFTKFRTLDLSTDYPLAKANAKDAFYAGSYHAQNLYPYKLRLDTFYQDGWRLPQTNMVYARSRGITPSQADTVAQDFMSKWQNRPSGQSYEQFYEANVGDEWFEELFNKGCTVIPTTEACNGYNMVDSNFELTGYHSGRAVEGLHEVTSEKDSTEPKGTILEVTDPGYVLAHKVRPAKVVVSNGAKYKEATQGAPHPLLPDLELPHQRTSSEWGSTWLPTHPSHFEAPAIWGWDDKTGRFLQLKGPLWDPLHYYYESVDMVVRAHKMPLNENKKLAPVPPQMKTRFYPIVPMQGFDVFCKQTKDSRKEAGVLPNSGIRRVPTQQTTCTIGYHPLPLQFEYELDSWWFPELAPRNRAEATDNPLFTKRLAEVIESKVDTHSYLDAIKEDNEIERLTRPEMLRPFDKNPLKNYPHLRRYKDPEIAFKEIVGLAPVLVQGIDPHRLQAPEEALIGEDLRMISQETGIPYYSAAIQHRLQAQEFLRLRDSLVSNRANHYILCWWLSIPFNEIESLIHETERNAS